MGETSRYPQNPPYDPRRRASTHGFEESGGDGGSGRSGDQTLHKWWQGIITLCIGLAAVGVVVWFFASSFFITKEKFQDDRGGRDNYQSVTSEQLITMSRTLSELSKTSTEILAQIKAIQIDIAVIKAPSTRRNR